MKPFEQVIPTDIALAKHTTVAFGHVDVLQPCPSGNHWLIEAGLFDAHVERVEMQGEIGSTYPSYEPKELLCGGTHIGFVAIDGLNT